MTKLEKYLIENNISISQFAKLTGMSDNYVFKLKKGYRNCRPSIAMIKKIMKATNNQVKAEDWLD